MGREKQFNPCEPGGAVLRRMEPGRSTDTSAALWAGAGSDKQADRLRAISHCEDDDLLLAACVTTGLTALCVSRWSDRRREVSRSLRRNRTGRDAEPAASWSSTTSGARQAGAGSCGIAVGAAGSANFVPSPSPQPRSRPPIEEGLGQFKTSCANSPGGRSKASGAPAPSQPRR